MTGEDVERSQILGFDEELKRQHASDRSLSHGSPCEVGPPRLVSHVGDTDRLLLIYGVEVAPLALGRLNLIDSCRKLARWCLRGDGSVSFDEADGAVFCARDHRRGRFGNSHQKFLRALILKLASHLGESDRQDVLACLSTLVVFGRKSSSVVIRAGHHSMLQQRSDHFKSLRMVRLEFAAARPGGWLCD